MSPLPRMMLAAALLAACGTAALRAEGADKNDWPMFRGGPQLTGVAPVELNPPLKIRWRVQGGEAVGSTAAIVDGVAYIGDDTGVLHAIDLNTGKPRWTFAVKEKDPINCGITVIEDDVLFGDDGGTLHALDRKTGTPRWSFKTDGQIISGVNRVGDRLVVGSYDGTLYCLARKDGALAWKYVSADRLHATPGVTTEGHVLISGCDGKLHVVDIADGSRVRQIELGSVTGSSAAILGQHAYLGTYGNEVLGVDWTAGSIDWRYSPGDKEFPFLSSAAVRGDLVVIGSRDKRVHALDRKTGKQRWEFVTRGRVDSSPVLSGDVVWVGSSDGSVYAIDAKSGAERWKFEAGAPITGSPAIGDGVLVIGAQDGMIYCLEPESR